MTKRLASKHKIDRRLRLNLWGRPRSPFNRREYGPGEHGQARKRRASDYALQLAAKQRLKGYYGNIGERQFRKLYQMADRRKGDTGENFIALLESRLDAVIYRLKFAPSPFAARQLISHGHVAVNGKRVNISSYRVSEGDEVALSSKAREIPMVIDAGMSEEREVPEYLSTDVERMKGRVVRIPKLEEVPYPVVMEPDLVIEYYSR